MKIFARRFYELLA